MLVRELLEKVVKEDSELSHVDFDSRKNAMKST